MSTISNTMSRPGRTSGATLIAFAGVLRRSWAAYMNWRLEQLAISQLASMSDRELRDVGITRSEIEFAVRIDAKRDWAFSRYY